MKTTILLIDVGNTSITYRLIQGSRALKAGTVIHRDIPLFIKKMSKSGSKSPSKVIFASVVPKISKKIRSGFKKKSGVSIMEVGKNLKIPLKHAYKSRKKLGIDRLLNAYQGLQQTKAPFLVMDFGTALTVDYVSKRGRFEGGMIVPGPELSFQALIKKAAMIPQSLRLPTKRSPFIGHNTLDCISSGTLQGYGAMVDGLVSRFKKRYGNLKVIATGGFAKNLKPYTNAFSYYIPDLTLKAIHNVYKASKV